MNQILDQLAIKKGTKQNLARMNELDAFFGYPSKSFRSIHVAGTNGKGSVCTKIANQLTHQGFKTGLFTSPHIHSFHERIKVDRGMISEQRASELISQIVEVSAEITFFEALTMMAFLYFREEKVSYAVIETGLGGTYDATNIIEPNLSIITNISFDHAAILGGTLGSIAENKAGIIKEETPVILGARASLKPMFRKAFEWNAPLYLMPLEENWVKENEQIAEKALSLITNKEVVDCDFDKPSCRYEIVHCGSLTVVFDIAHNIDAMEKLFKKVQEDFPEKELSVLFSVGEEAKLESMIPLIESYTSKIFVFEHEHPRLLSKNRIEKALSNHHQMQLERFIENAKNRSDLVIVTGSVYIMKAAREQLSHLLPCAR